MSCSSFVYGTPGADIEKVLGVDPPIRQRGGTIASQWPPTIGSIETRLAYPTLALFS